MLQQYKIDEYGKEILLQDNQHQVMMEWEKPYMEACIDKLQPKGDVLEIGFGMGYSATQIQKYNPKSHTIIECDDTVISKAKKDGFDIVKGRWQDAIHNLGNFDFIFFDDHSYCDADNDIDISIDKDRLRLFIDVCINYHLNSNGLISFYYNKEDSLIDKFKTNPNIQYTEKTINIEIPSNCSYRKGNKCIVPKITLL